MDIYNLKFRQVVFLNGEDAISLLESLVTNHVDESADLKYAFLLSPQGRILFDLFYWFEDGKLYIDVSSSVAEEFINKLRMYILRSKVKIEKCDHLNVFFSKNKITDDSKLDPRLKNLGYRSYAQELEGAFEADESYFEYMLENGVLNFEKDIIVNKSLALETGVIAKNAVSMTKGCYVGQEVTSRMHYRGNIRKDIFILENKNNDKFSISEEIKNNGSKVGIALGDYKNKMYALLKRDGVKDQEFIHSDKGTLKILNRFENAQTT